MLFRGRITVTSVVISLGLSFLLVIVLTAYPSISNTVADDDNDLNFQQLGDLRTCTVQEKNIQGRVIVGTIFADICEGTDNSETIIGLQDNDVLSGEGGDDIIQGNEGDDKILGNAGDDLLQGNEEDDKIDGGGRNDVLVGGGGDDILSGEDGDDKLYGEASNIVLRGIDILQGNDILKGGPGADEFVCGGGVDTVLDYNPNEGDTISSDCENVNTV